MLTVPVPLPDAPYKVKIAPGLIHAAGQEARSLFPMVARWENTKCFAEMAFNVFAAPELTTGRRALKRPERESH